MKLKNLFAKITRFIAGIFNKVDKAAKKFIPIGIEIVNRIKKFADSDTADLLTLLIPGDLDNALKEFLRKVTPSILIGLRNWDSIMNVQDPSKRLDLILKELVSLPKAERDGLKLELATRINTAILGFKNSATEALPVSDVKILTLAAYHYPEVLDYEETV